MKALGGMLKMLPGIGGMLGGGSSEQQQPAAAPAAPAAAAAKPGVAGVAPGTSPDDFKRQQQAYYQQLFSGTGQIEPGGGLPEGVQQNIDKQAALI